MKRRERIEKEFCHRMVSELFEFHQLPTEVIKLVEPNPLKYITQIIDMYAEIKANVAKCSTDNAPLHGVVFSEERAEVCRCRNKECLRCKGGICMTAGFTCVDRQT